MGVGVGATLGEGVPGISGARATQPQEARSRQDKQDQWCPKPRRNSRQESHPSLAFHRVACFHLPPPYRRKTDRAESPRSSECNMVAPPVARWLSPNPRSRVLFRTPVKNLPAGSASFSLVGQWPSRPATCGGGAPRRQPLPGSPSWAACSFRSRSRASRSETLSGARASRSGR